MPLGMCVRARATIAFGFQLLYSCGIKTQETNRLLVLEYVVFTTDEHFLKDKAELYCLIKKEISFMYSTNGFKKKNRL